MPSHHGDSQLSEPSPEPRWCKVRSDEQEIDWSDIAERSGLYIDELRATEKGSVSRIERRVAAPPRRMPTPTATDEGGGGHAGEEPLTGDIAAQVEAAALAEYPDATVVRLETDSDGVYEAHLETADGPEVTVEVDENFEVTGEETHP